MTIEQTPEERAAWLEERRSSVGSSDSPVLFGEGYVGQTPLTLWESKVFPGAEEPEPELERLMLGRCLEDAILNAWGMRSGIFALRHGRLKRHGLNDWLTCTPDAMTRQGHPVEIKNLSRFNADFVDGAFPRKYVIQLQHQMLVLAAPLGYLVALVDGQELVWDEVKADPALQLEISQRASVMMNHVRAKTPPPVTADEADRKALSRVYSMPDRPVEVSLPEAEALEIDGDIARLKAEIKAREETLALAENRLRELICKATPGLDIEEKDERKWVAKKGDLRAGLYAHLANGARYKLTAVDVEAATTERKAHTQYRMTRSEAK